jgi:hypothetical protein
MARNQTMRGSRNYQREDRSGRHEEAGYVQQAYDTAQEAYGAATDTVSHWPATSVLTAFGIGLGFGMLLGYVMSEPARDERSSLARFGRNMLDSMSRYVPESVSKYVS